MKYVAKYVEENENISEPAEFSYAMRVIFRVVLVAFALYLALGIIVDVAVPYIPPAWEDSLAAPIMREVYASGQKSQKFDVVKIQQLLDSLAGLMEGVRRKFYITVIEKDETNALALPGGHIVVYSQLLEKVASENELAMILAHELGHFAARDHLRGLGRSFLFFIVANFALGGQGDSVRQFMNSSGILQNNYSRQQEFAADKYALEMLVKKYGHAGGATDFFKRLAEKEKLPQLVHYLSTHPASDRRVSALNQIVTDNSYAVYNTEPVNWSVGEKPDK
ncbi:MAG: peptidase M48 [Candidatus Riflebacteria bacterium HGW-Riflebacteria-1]|jgi:predicted Zn-dependent protease|nr:MAG: peptidase M48 [Candidatus Riflebacteria bacterium HGW-Riflebacteria-1]